MSGRAPKNLKPSTPRASIAATHFRACSGVVNGSSRSDPKVT
jgi:hypothetical protein